MSGEYFGHGSSLTPDGWFRTNGGGHLDEAGFLFAEGRLDDVIVLGGEKARLRSSRTPERLAVLPQLPYNDTGKLLRRQLKVELPQLPGHSIENQS